MKNAMRKAEAAVKDVLREFEPTKGHFVAGTREFLLAMRSVVDAEIALFDRATKKKKDKPNEQGGA
ncbi:MAG: hypothetical protein NT049_03730 [Planctomycetota bacterium]|nr:hypothetical protein [Planctomycetota bacterium]